MQQRPLKQTPFAPASSAAECLMPALVHGYLTTTLAVILGWTEQ
jgi:hypothetical protein